MVYLSARPGFQRNFTRRYILDLVQDGLHLPDGAVIVNNKSLIGTIWEGPAAFKTRLLTSVQELFDGDRVVFYGGFGNEPTDKQAYLNLNIPKKTIFNINTDSVVNMYDGTLTTYPGIEKNVTQIFP